MYPSQWPQYTVEEYLMLVFVRDGLTFRALFIYFYRQEVANGLQELLDYDGNV